MNDQDKNHITTQALIIPSQPMSPGLPLAHVRVRLTWLIPQVTPHSLHSDHSEYDGHSTPVWHMDWV